VCDSTKPADKRQVKIIRRGAIGAVPIGLGLGVGQATASAQIVLIAAAFASFVVAVIFPRRVGALIRACRGRR
jgi:hypothetical protein